jgi:hypothetical protein
MRRGIAFFMAALIGGVVLMLQPVPASAQGEGYYADLGGDYGAEDYGPRDNGPRDNGHSKYERPYLAYSYSPKYKPGHDDYRDADYKEADYKRPYSAYASGYGHGNGYGHGHGYKKRYPKWRKTCVYGPLREKKVCDYEPRQCWKERECYYVYGKKYCRYYTKCSGGGKSCYWIKKPYYGHGCNRDY